MGFKQRIAPYVNAELDLARQQHASGNFKQEFHHLERAHVLGQASTYWHIKVHMLMFVWGLRQRSLAEMAGQFMRIFGAATKTALGWVPEGNTGGANVSPFKPMPIPTDLAENLRKASSR